MKDVHGNLIEKFRSGDPQNKYEKRLNEIKQLQKNGKVKLLRNGSTRGRWGWDLIIIYQKIENQKGQSND
jgi:hypothetical protein